MKSLRKLELNFYDVPADLPYPNTTQGTGKLDKIGGAVTPPLTGI